MKREGKIFVQTFYSILLSIYFKSKFTVYHPASINYCSHGQRAALEALQCGPSTDSEKRYFGAKSIRSLEKTQILALKMAIFQKCGPRVDLG
jgi:hypothetical protein